MSSICGIVNLDGSPVKSSSLNNMLSAMSVLGHDTKDCWCNGSVGLGNLLLYNSPHSRYEKLPLVDSDNGLVIVSTSRIDNREELFNKLGIPEQQRLTMPDSRLFLKCFEKWKYECPDLILGEWSFAIWSTIEKELFICRSHYGMDNLYYYKSGKTFYFASSLKGLLVLEEIPKEINDFRLGQSLIGWGNSLGKTVYKNMNRFNYAHYLRVSTDKFEIKRYWVLEDTPPTRFNTDSEYAEAFKEIYTEAVKCRLVSSKSIGSSLSGGLDSGSVTALAAMELKKIGKPLNAFSSVPLLNVDNFPNKNRFADESEYINATAAHAGNIEVNFIKSENLSPLRALKKAFQIMDEPQVGINFYWILSMFQAAREKGIGTFLIGQKGNTAVSWKGIFNGFVNWHAFTRNMNELNYFSYFHTLRAIKNYLIIPAIPKRIHIYRMKQNDFKINWQKHSPINNNFAVEQNFIEKMKVHGRYTIYNYGNDPRKLQFNLIKPRYQNGSVWSEIGLYHNLSVTDPTADKRLLEFCTSIPNDQFYRKGIEKYLFKRAMKGILPDKVLYSSKRGQQAADIQKRLAKELPEIKSIIAGMKSSEICNHYLDIAKIESALSRLNENSLKAFQDTSSILFKGIATGLFLKKFE